MQGSAVDQDGGNIIVEVSQRQWGLRLSGVDMLDGVRVITRDRDETLSDVCRHAMENAAARGQNEEAIIVKKTATGFKTFPDDHLV